MLLANLRGKNKISHDILLSLLHEGADVNCVDGFGYSPLILAVRSMHLDIIPTLIQAGADLSYQSPKLVHLPSLCGM